MIVASPKSITELKQLIAGHQKVLFAGCGTCVTVCLAGGEREVGIAGYAVRMARKLAGRAAGTHPGDHRAPVRERVHQRPGRSRRRTWTPSSRSAAAWACRPSPSGSRTCRSTPVSTPSSWASSRSRPSGRRSAWAAATACLPSYGGICPVTRCAKRLLNGPCGGSTEESCEVDPDRPCAWQLIYARLKSIDQLDRLEEVAPPKDWSTSWHAGARKVVRKEHRV